MWETWLSWILIGGLILFMFRRGGCCGHAGPISPGNDGKESDANRKQTHGGCH